MLVGIEQRTTKKSYTEYLHLTIDLYDTNFVSRAYQPKDRIATITVVMVAVAVMVSTALQNTRPEFHVPTAYTVKCCWQTIRLYTQH